jgi:REP element-mobilizing transposase RayT
LTQFITFRLYDSVPEWLLRQWRLELAHLPKDERRQEEEVRMNRYADDGRGSCYLARPEIASIVENALLYYHGERYEMHAWTIMPNHVHCLARFDSEAGMWETIKAWKGYTGRRANEALKRRGPFWYRDFYDRFIRNGEHFDNVVRYIDRNPVKARLCANAQGWAYGSARLRSPADMNVGGPRQ